MMCLEWFCILTDPDANSPIFAVVNNLLITEQTVHLTLIPDDLYSNLDYISLSF